MLFRSYLDQVTKDLRDKEMDEDTEEEMEMEDTKEEKEDTEAES